MKSNNKYLSKNYYYCILTDIIFICVILVIFLISGCYSRIQLIDRDNNIMIEPKFVCKKYSSSIDNYIFKNFNPKIINRYTYDVTISISKTGDVQKVVINNDSILSETDSLFIRTLYNMPKFEPAKKGSENIESSIRLKIHISPQKNS